MEQVDAVVEIKAWICSESRTLTVESERVLIPLPEQRIDFRSFPTCDFLPHSYA